MSPMVELRQYLHLKQLSGIVIWKLLGLSIEDGLWYLVLLEGGKRARLAQWVDEQRLHCPLPFSLLYLKIAVWEVVGRFVSVS